MAGKRVKRAPKKKEKKRREKKSLTKKEESAKFRGAVVCAQLAS